MKDLSKYSIIVGYGIGQYYELVKTQIENKIKLNYLCDSRISNVNPIYDNIPVINPEQLREMHEVFVVIFAGNPRNYESISSSLKQWGLPYCHANELLQQSRAITGKDLKAGSYTNHYTDINGNEITFFDDIEDTVVFNFSGGNNRICIGPNVSVGNLKINCGRNAVCTIGSDTMIEEATVIVTDGKIEIGKDCLFSFKVVIRNNDTHHFFDKTTGKRINYPGNIAIGNHVWLGQNATLLGNASIGDNSIVGTMAVTSSKFPEAVVIAGNPAKIVRENICWSKDNVEFFCRDTFEECLAKEALKYD